MNYFTADTHFFHKSLIHDRIFSNRDFLCVEEMNEQIMDAWNEVVCDQDTVYQASEWSNRFRQGKSRFARNVQIS